MDRRVEFALSQSVFVCAAVASAARAQTTLVPPSPSQYERFGISTALDGQPYTALNGGPRFTFNEAISLQISCADQDEVDHYWNALSEGGEESRCGWLKDRYGLSWQIVPSALEKLLTQSDVAKRTRVMQALMQMTKLDIATLEKA